MLSVSITENRRERIELTRKGLHVLLYWAIGNIVLAAVLRLVPGIGFQSFWEMTAFWNVVNLVIAAMGLRRLGRNIEPTSVAAEIGEAHRMEKVLLFNGGLDVGYMMFGLFLTQLSSGPMYESYPGWGAAIVVQGLFLFVFDTLFAWRLSKVRVYEGGIER